MLVWEPWQSTAGSRLSVAGFPGTYPGLAKPPVNHPQVSPWALSSSPMFLPPICASMLALLQTSKYGSASPYIVPAPCGTGAGEPGSGWVTPGAGHAAGEWNTATAPVSTPWSGPAS